MSIKDKVFLIIISILLNSCSYTNVIIGNHYYDLGNYNDAIIEYNKVLNSDIKTKPWILYNIATTYRQMGEISSTFTILDDDRETNNRDLNFSINHLKGVIYYTWGDYIKSKEYLLKAMYINPKDTNLKRDLELCIKKLKNMNFQIESNKPKNEMPKPTNLNVLDSINKKDIMLKISNRNQKEAVDRKNINDW